MLVCRWGRDGRDNSRKTQNNELLLTVSKSTHLHVDHDQTRANVVVNDKGCVYGHSTDYTIQTT